MRRTTSLRPCRRTCPPRRRPRGAEAQCRFCDKVSIVYDATNAACRQTFKGRAHLTSGSLTVSNGTLAVTGAAFVQNRAADTAGSLTVSEGDFVFTDKGSWLNGSSVCVTNAGKIVVNHSKTFSRRVTLSAADTGKFELAAGVRQRCAALRLNGKRQKGGTYGAAGSGAANIDNDHFSGLGQVEVCGGGFIMLLR